jgi:hypothetical protein
VDITPVMNIDPDGELSILVFIFVLALVISLSGCSSDSSELNSRINEAEAKFDEVKVEDLDNEGKAKYALDKMAYEDALAYVNGSKTYKPLLNSLEVLEFFFKVENIYTIPIATFDTAIREETSFLSQMDYDMAIDIAYQYRGESQFKYPLGKNLIYHEDTFPLYLYYYETRRQYWIAFLEGLE